MMSSRRSLALPMGWVALALLAVRAAMAHPFHVSLAEMEFNQEANAIEVALRVFPDDLELALREASGDDELVLERAENLAALVAEYLREAFVLTRAAGDAAPLRWVGLELNVKEAWLYFELLAPGELDGVSLTNRLFFEVRPSQINSVVLSIANEVRSLSFTLADPTQPLIGAHLDTPLALDVERRHQSLVAIIQDAIHLSPSQRAAFELLGACAAETLLHGANEDEEDQTGALLDEALELAGRQEEGAVPSGERARLAILAARAGRTRVAFNLLAESVATSAAHQDADTVIPEALHAAAALASRHDSNDLAQELSAAADDAIESQILALGRARALLEDHHHHQDDHTHHDQ